MKRKQRDAGRGVRGALPVGAGAGRPADAADYIWGAEALERHLRHENPEVRAWAAGRLLLHFPGAVPDSLASLVLDDDAGMGEEVAAHLGRHGSERHVPILVRGFRHGRATLPGACLEALGRLGYAEVEPLAAGAVGRQDLGPEGSAAVLGAVLRHGEPEASREVARALLHAHPGVLVEPEACEEAFRRMDSTEFPALMRAFLAALAWRGADQAAGAFQSMLEALEVDDVGWLLHTDRADHILLDRTLKAFDATYDLESRRGLGEGWSARLGEAFAEGSLPRVAAVVGEFVRERAPSVVRAGDPLPGRVAALVEALAAEESVSEMERLGPAAASSAVVALLSCALKLADFRSPGRDLRTAGGNLGRLLRLLEVESAVLRDVLPDAVAEAVRTEEDRARAVHAAAEILGRRGPWYGRLLALDLLARLRGVEAAHEVIRCLEEDAPAILEAAGRALEAMGPGAVESIHTAYEEGRYSPAGLEWLVAAISQAGTHESLGFLMDHLDDLVGELDAGFVCEWTALLGAEELIARFRALLDRDTAAVGRALLLLSAIHNRPVPEEQRILSALDHDHRDEEPDAGTGGTGSEGGPYLM